MARYLDPKNDLTFKRIFAEHPHLLIQFLNAVMPFDEDSFIEEITYLPSEMTPDNPLKKYSIDLPNSRLCRLQNCSVN